ncbi:unnamed protein product, partial [Polarella glacialis]
EPMQQLDPSASQASIRASSRAGLISWRRVTPEMLVLLLVLPLLLLLSLLLLLLSLWVLLLLSGIIFVSSAEINESAQRQNILVLLAWFPSVVCVCTASKLEFILSKQQ